MAQEIVSALRKRLRPMRRRRCIGTKIESRKLKVNGAPGLNINVTDGHIVEKYVLKRRFKEVMLNLRFILARSSNRRKVGS